MEFILGQDISVETDDNESAVIKAKGYIIGQVSTVRSDDRQNVNITFAKTFKKETQFSGSITEWTLRASAKSIQEGDIICFLQRASDPTIIKLHKNYLMIVVIAASPLGESGSLGQLEFFKSTTHALRDFLLVWDWGNPLEEIHSQEKYRTLTKTNSQIPQYPKAEFGDTLGKAIRTSNIAIVLGDLKEYEKAQERLQEAIEGYERAFGEGRPYTLKGRYGPATQGVLPNALMSVHSTSTSLLSLSIAVL